jgi:hypothetical protein
MVAASLGIVLLLLSWAIHIRYASDLSALHEQERIHYARFLGYLWQIDFYGSASLIVLSLFGLGWLRGIGLLASFGALSFSLMTLGALCGPFGC